MASKSEQPASHSGPTLQQQQQPQQLSSISRQQQQQQQQNLQNQQAALQNSVLVYVSGDNLAYASALDQQNAIANYQQHQQNNNNQQESSNVNGTNSGNNATYLQHLPQVYGDKNSPAGTAGGFLSQATKDAAHEFDLAVAEIEQQEPLRTSSRGSDEEESGHSLGPDDDDLGDDGNFVVSQLEAACDADIIYQDDDEQDHNDETQDREHLKLLKLSKAMLDGCNGYAAINGVYAAASLGFPLDDKSLGAYAAAEAELDAACDANGNHQVAFVRQNGNSDLALYSNTLISNEQAIQQQQNEQNQLVGADNGLLGNEQQVVSAGQVIKLTDNHGGVVPFANLGSCDSVRSDTAESTCSSLSSHESQEVALQQAANFVAAQQAVRDAAEQQQQRQVFQQVLDDAMNNAAGACDVVQVQQQEQQSITVPTGWKRICTNGVIIYIR